MPDFEKKNIIAIFCAGESGINDIVKEKYDELSAYYSTEMLDGILEKAACSFAQYKKLAETFEKSGFAKRNLIKVGEGGILAALYQYAKEFNRGLEIKLKSIPVNQACIEICEHYSINPYRLRSKMLVTVGETSYSDLENLLKMKIPAAHIGYLTEDKDKAIVDKEELQHIDRPSKDEIYKVL